MTSPIPRPMMIPPKMVDKNGSVVTGSICSKIWLQKESTMMANMEDTARRRPKLFITKNKEWDIQQYDEYAEGNPCQLGKKQRHTGHTAVNDVVRYKKQIQPR